MGDERLKSAINTLATINERLSIGGEILPGEDVYEWLLEVNQTIQEILGEADGCA